MSQVGFRVWAGIIALGISGSWANLAPAAPQQGKEPPRIGNGALLKRMFGGSEDQTRGPGAERSGRNAPQKPTDLAAEKAKSPWDQARNATRESWEAGRQRFQADSDKLKERLGLKSAEESPAEPTGIGREAANLGREAANLGREAANPGRGPGVVWSPDRQEGAANRPVEPRSNFAPQGGSRSSISDQGERSTVARPVSDLRQVPGRGNADAGVRSPLVGGSVGDNNRVPGPINQPRVPAERTYAPAANLPRSVVVAAEDLPIELKFGAFGATAVPAARSGSGLVVKSVRPQSIAAQLGLLPGDIITNVAGIAVDFIEEIDSLVEVLEAEDEFDLTFQRAGKPQSKSFRMPAR